MTMKKKLVAGLAVGCVVLGLAELASANLLFDRGLPTKNLNNAAGSNRSNVAWAFGADNQGTWLAGDDFLIGGVGSFLVNTIRVWAANDDQQLDLWLGASGGTFTKYLSTSSTSATYANGETYQGSSGNYRGFRQYDFDLNMVVSGATTYQFFLDGSSSPYTFLHSSNAALGGSPAQGADDHMLYALVSSGGLTDIGSWSSGDTGWGWDKGSDANIQVYGSPVPEPATMLLMSTGLVGLVGTRRKKK